MFPLECVFEMSGDYSDLTTFFLSSRTNVLWPEINAKWLEVLSVLPTVHLLCCNTDLVNISTKSLLLMTHLLRTNFKNVHRNYGWIKCQQICILKNGLVENSQSSLCAKFFQSLWSCIHDFLGSKFPLCVIDVSLQLCKETQFMKAQRGNFIL